MIMRSENVPESPSSALQTTYLGVAGASAAVFHLIPVGKPAPPRPRRPDCVTSAITASGPMSIARFRPRYPRCAMKSSSDTGSVTPARANVSRVCDFSHGISSATPRRRRCARPSRKLESNSDATSRAHHRSVCYSPGAGRDFDHRLMREHPAGAVAHYLYVPFARRRFFVNRLGNRIGAERHRARVARNVNDGHRTGLDDVTVESISSKRSGLTRP